MPTRTNAVGKLAAFLAVGANALLACHPALAQKTTWDRAETIKAAAERLVVLHRKEGSQGVLKFLDACYKTHMLSGQYTEAIEGCLAQDYMHSKILSIIYARVPAHGNPTTNAPSPQSITLGLGQRYAAVFNEYGLGATEAKALQALVEKHGMKIFIAGVLPQQKKDKAPN